MYIYDISVSIGSIFFMTNRYGGRDKYKNYITKLFFKSFFEALLNYDLQKTKTRRILPLKFEVTGGTMEKIF